MKPLLLILLFGCYSNQIFSQNETRLRHFNLSQGVAVQGYDVVAYFTQGKAVEGSKNYSSSVEGITYYFSSAANRDLFNKDFHRYEPQYGGWCAYAMGATQEKVEIDPETFKIVNGKLYLFYHSWYNNTLPKWNENEATLKTNADKYWQNIFK